MAVRWKVKSNGEKVAVAYWNARSARFPNIRVQKYQECLTEEEAKKVERRLIKETTEEVARREALGTCWKAVVNHWETEAKDEEGNFRNPLTGKKMTSQTVRDTVSVLKNWTHEWLAIPAGELTRKHGKDVIRAAEDAELSKSHVKRIKNAVQTVFDFGIQEGVILGAKQSPVFGVLLSSPDNEELPEILSVEEVRKLLVTARAINHEWYPIWAVALTTGMRSSELYALRKENVLLKEGLIRISESWDWHQDKAKSTKGGYWRNAPIPSSLVPILDPLMKTEGEFLLPRLERWEEGLQAQVLRNFCLQIGIKSVRFHALRACFATHLLASGVEDVKVMRIGGWRDFKTFERYVRLSGIREKGLSESLGQVILPTDQSVAEHLGSLYNGSAA